MDESESTQVRQYLSPFLFPRNNETFCLRSLAVQERCQRSKHIWTQAMQLKRGFCWLSLHQTYKGTIRKGSQNYCSPI